MGIENPRRGDKKILAYAGKLWSMGKGSTARKGYLSLIDQSFLSGTNFITALVLARCTGKTEFAVYRSLGGWDISISNKSDESQEIQIATTRTIYKVCAINQSRKTRT